MPVKEMTNEQAKDILGAGVILSGQKRPPSVALNVEAKNDPELLQAHQAEEAFLALMSKSHTEHK
jgi:hypothetical protein